MSEYSSALLTRASNCALAAMLGDALGAAYEGHGFADVTKEAGPLGCREHKAAGHMGVYNDGERTGCYTDDTNSAVAILRSASSLGRIDARDIAYRHARQWLDGFSLGFLRGYPGSAQAMMMETLKGSDARTCATISFADGSFANGAAMKIWPLAVAMHDKTKVSAAEFYEAVRAACCFSHIHPQAVDSAVSLAETIRWALHYKLEGEEGGNSDWCPQKDGNELLKIAHEACEEEVVKGKVEELRAAYGKLPPPAYPINAKDPKKKDLLTPERYTEEINQLHAMLKVICGKSMGFQIEGWSALVCSLAVAARHGANIEDVIAYSVGVGGDTDTVASMAGAISGALQGGTSSQWCDPKVKAALENRTEEGLMGRDWITDTAVNLAKKPLTEVRQAKPGESAASAAPRSVFDSAAEACGQFWQNPMQSQGFDHFRSELFTKVLRPNQEEIQKEDEKSGTDTFESVIPMVFNKVKAGSLTPKVLAALAEVRKNDGATKTVLELDHWMDLTDPKRYK